MYISYGFAQIANEKIKILTGIYRQNILSIKNGMN
jgi:hypothetical protein